MPSLFTAFKSAVNGVVQYAELSLGTDPSDQTTPRRLPQSAPSDAAGAPLYAAGVIPALDGTDATGVTPPAGGAGLRGWLSGIYGKLPALVGGKIPVDIGGESIVISGNVTIPGSVEISNDAGNAIPVSVAQLPASLGQKAGALSLPVVLSSDGPFATNFGLITDAAATSDAGTFGFIALFKRSLGYLATLAGAVSSGIVQVATRSNAPRVTATGPLAAIGNTVSLALDGMSTAVVQLSGTWAGTVAWLASIDGGTTYFPVNLIPYAGGAAVGSTTGNGQWEFACGGLTHLQAQMTAFTSGSATALIAATNGAKSVRVGAPTANPVPTREQPGITPVQSYVAVPAFVSGNTAGVGGTNATAALAVTTTSATGFLSIDNTGSTDAEVWFGAIPADASVGQSPKKGKLLPAGAGLFFDVRIPVGPIYVTAPSATGLSVVTG